jgi:hypothetical protein
MGGRKRKRRRVRANRRRSPRRRRRRARRNAGGLASLPIVGPLFKAGTLQMVFGVSVGGAVATVGGAMLHNFVAKQMGPGSVFAKAEMKPLYTVLTGLVGATLLGAMKQKKMAGYVLIGGGVAAATELINKFVVSKLPGAQAVVGTAGYGDYVQLPYSGYGSPAQVAAGDFGSVAQVEAGSFGSSFNPSF